MTEGHIEPKPHPSLNLPPHGSIVTVKIINTTSDLVCGSDGFIQPVLEGHEVLNLPTFAFLIENETLGKTILFDLGARKDWWNLAPSVQKVLKMSIKGCNIRQGIDEILQKGGVPLGEIESVIWSHWHWDHCGDMSLFPGSTELVVGPGFKGAVMPGYPTNPNGVLLDSDFEGREVREITFESDFKIGQYPAQDFFGDGSFYLLDVPGHAVGHIAGLARTTANTWVFMGGDVCHFGGSFRPTAYAPMPQEIPADVPMDPWFPKPCPCTFFTDLHPNPDKGLARTEPFFQVTQKEPSWYIDPSTAQQSIDRLQDFDADENVFVAIAHDSGLMPVVEWFPHGTMNDWKEKGWKEAIHWGFVNDLPVKGKSAKPDLAPGRIRDGKVVE
ncbi:hypothetical protein SAICODRAFT_69419 [Saitoella complicata NRRL Y-17804]|uniref:Metallo-beta-lactamase domain-containing protein n=1 Tax=Saitoella complicata (strain BCRC 22490 / CBS 7301 / JCM 7358 / NBRC 10748 / NRRL Y-17804) TaxID=698492 RepID=A0A0E9NP63_SAICN|nr:uncharacterized protein SAICODRAFT_69419 [Saitoella complicata NRRL Y-17804]ODQ55428.1 hypothetical protein SAICODRAFT_69419 [Saitoella complicata NRRL Y-17804]GAO51220.1 hypothetical protein G7K_5328-t1 [Saitoella complicata NRRL Y-17804]